jgi:hypothetical protein
MELALWVSGCKFQSLFFEVLNAVVLKINLCALIIRMWASIIVAEVAQSV